MLKPPIRKTLVVAATLVLLAALSPLTPAQADIDVDVNCDRANQVWLNCTTSLETSGSGGSAGSNTGSPSSSSSSSSGPRECVHDGVTVPCHTAFGTWRTHQAAWCRVTATTPDPADPAWAGHTTGSIYQCTRPGGTATPDPNLTYRTWLPDEPNQPPDPQQLARRAIEQMNLHAINIATFPPTTNTNPDAYALVGWHIWLWAENPTPNTWGPITRTATLDGYSVTATATVKNITWNMGDGTTITCNQGTPANNTARDNNPSPTCSHRYEQQGKYQITATSHWQITWHGIGQNGTINHQLTQHANLTIAELQVLVTSYG
ncbi:MAG: hypothetical protein CSA63_01135 [Propionibacterium sp.]|nr:MAG: hypothetical protein CSA63_01135 [Propionibacterium sp.]